MKKVAQLKKSLKGREEKVIVIDDNEKGTIRVTVKYKDMPLLLGHLRKLGAIIKVPKKTKALMDFYTNEKVK